MSVEGLPSFDDFRGEDGEVDWAAYRKAAVLAAAGEKLDEVEQLREKEEPGDESGTVGGVTVPLG